MPNSESLAADGDQATPITIPSESEDQVVTPDPLLGSGSFIDPNNGGDQNQKQNASKETENASANPDSIHLKYTRPSWLPENFEMILRKRTSGATEGTVDRYYIAPSGQRLRSKNEVLTFLETGAKRKKTTPSTPNSDDAASEGSAPRSKKKTSARKKVHAAFSFDFRNPPEKVSWCLTYATEDVWSPRIGDWELPLATKQEWASVFNHVCQS
ncbi:methyl-CpG-binding domain-containing protein 5 [Lactuca sativa]|uniref:MBD domain-containing protein n=2 Tax=Lactuca TaxID=4235 RepID=A0AA36E0L9_LACSI|nr:methyl-CpG-binding domain-containing protein 5 [Lactuca sativa]KAJ0215957.1 hypothetical protein LSAT_V11C300146620 [Lactuca sativa]CAI9277497.1 unnamed protein product [Lactuca saligna]